MNAKEKFLALLKGADPGAPLFVAPGALFISAPEGLGKSDRGTLGLPYRMTVESEAYGGEREEATFGASAREFEYPLREPGDYRTLPALDVKSSGRLPQVCAAIKAATEGPFGGSLPVIADLVGPVR